MDKILKYVDQLTQAMAYLAKNSKTIFIGQSVQYPGHALYNTIKHIDMAKRIEMPVAEELQMGISIGLAIQGFIPITIYPRFDFLLLGLNQLINHLDKFKKISHNKMSPKVIVRVAVGSINPMDPGVQHKQDYTEAIKNMVTEIKVMELTTPESIMPSYKKALNFNGSTILIENCNQY